MSLAEHRAFPICRGCYSAERGHAACTPSFRPPADAANGASPPKGHNRARWGRRRQAGAARPRRCRPWRRRPCAGSDDDGKSCGPPWSAIGWASARQHWARQRRRGAMAATAAVRLGAQSTATETGPAAPLGSAHPAADARRGCQYRADNRGAPSSSPAGNARSQARCPTSNRRGCQRCANAAAGSSAGATVRQGAAAPCQSHLAGRGEPGATAASAGRPFQSAAGHVRAARAAGKGLRAQHASRTSTASACRAHHPARCARTGGGAVIAAAHCAVGPRAQPPARAGGRPELQPQCKPAAQCPGGAAGRFHAASARPFARPSGAGWRHAYRAEHERRPQARLRWASARAGGSGGAGAGRGPGALLPAAADLAADVATATPGLGASGSCARRTEPPPTPENGFPV
jgi:hypothetical protein